MNRRRLAALLIVLVAVAVAGAIWWTRYSSTRSSTPPRTPTAEVVAGSGGRVIFIGLDGADWTLLDQYIQRGTMPTLAGLVRDGASGTLTTLHPPLSPLLWTTMVTGVSPLEHRILDFLRVNPVSRKREPITSDERQVPAIWNMATYSGKRAAALGFWATYPAEAVNGLLVSDRLFTFLYSESTPPPGVVNPSSEEAWARGVLARVEREVDYAAVKELLPWLTEAEYEEAAKIDDPYAHPVSALKRIVVETRVYDTLAREWLARNAPDVLLVYIQGTDSIGHVFAPYAPPRQPEIPEREYERYSAVPERYFASVDRMLGEYKRLAESTGSTLMLASDHGFKWGEGRPTKLSSVANATAARWHQDEGIYLLWGPGINPSAASHPGRGTVQQVCTTLLALLGLPAGKGLAGPPLDGAPALAGDTVDYRTRYTPADVAASASSGTSRVDDETVAKLRALGYIGASSGQGRAIGTRTAGSFNNEALLLKQQGKTTEAMDAFEQALVVDPNLASASWNLSDMLFAQGNLDKSDALLVRAFANGLPEGTRFLIGRAIGYQRDGKIARSVQLLTAAAAAKADEPEVWLFRGRYRVESGDCHGALGDFQRAIALSPENASAYASRGLAELCAGRAAQARKSFERSLELDPNQPKVREYLRSGRGALER